MKRFPLFLKKSLCIGAVFCFSHVPVQAGYVIVEGFQGHAINGDASSPNMDVITRGDLVYAYNGGGGAQSVTINGVLFEGVSKSPASGTQTYGSITCSSSGGSFGNANPGSATGYVPAGGVASGALSGDYRELLQGGLGVSGSQGASVTLTLDNLQVNHTYLLQIWFNDSRTDKTSVTSSIRFGAQDPSEAISVKRNNGDSNSYLGSYVTVAFTVDSSSQSFLLSNGNYVMFNALQVRDITPVPESSTVALAGLAFLGLVARRKR